MLFKNSNYNKTKFAWLQMQFAEGRGEQNILQELSILKVSNLDGTQVAVSVNFPDFDLGILHLKDVKYHQYQKNTVNIDFCNSIKVPVMIPLIIKCKKDRTFNYLCTQISFSMDMCKSDHNTSKLENWSSFGGGVLTISAN